MRPLDGITVVALEHAIAAPFATRQLADLGARVIKIERPGVGDFARGYDTRVKGLASHFVWTNRSKESLSLDVKHPDAGGNPSPERRCRSFCRKSAREFPNSRSRCHANFPENDRLRHSRPARSTLEDCGP